MKKKLFFLCLFILISKHCFAYTQLDPKQPGTHYVITQHAINQSNIAQYLTDYLDIKLGDRFQGPEEVPIPSEDNKLNVQQWLQYGGDWEDVPVTRALNHFYDPLSGRGLPGDDSALNWAWQGMPSFWAWNDARHYFYRALSSKTVLGDTSTDPAVREYNLAKTFRALGQIVHLLQDMAVPAHTRLDIHPDEETFGSVVGQYQQDMYELYTATASLSYGGYVMQPIPFNKFDDYWHTDSGGKGLADFTNRNFLSRNTNLDDNEYACPVAINRATIEEQYVTDRSTNEPSLVYVKYASGNVFDDYTGERKPITHLAAYSFFDYEMENENGHKVYSLDEECHKEYASFLIPRAVGYSAGLLNYFFRGTIGVTEAVVIAGDANGIKKISAKAVNTTPNDTTPTGEVFAFARYKTGTEPEYSYSVSTSATDESGAPVTSIDRSTATKMTFDFSSNAIPADAHDIYLHVVYYGDLGNEEATGVAIGMDEVSKLYVLLKSGDYYTVFSALTNTVVKNLKNPLYGLKNDDGSLQYPNATEMYHFPSDGICKTESSECPYFDALLSHFNQLDTISLFEEITDPILMGYDNKQQKLPPIENEPPSRKYPSLSSVTGCSYPLNGMLVPASDGHTEGWYKSYNEYWSRNEYVLGQWNKINKHENVMYSSSYEEYSRSDNTTMEYTGSWVRQPVTTGCEGLLEDPYNQEQCAAQCACNREKVGHTIMTITGEHDDTTSSLRMITTKKYTPLGLLWNVPFIDMDYQSNSQGNVYMECTYSVEQCGIQANNLCGGYYTSLTKPGGVYSWDTPDTVEYGENMKTIIPHTSENDYYYNTITGHIHADSQQVLQIHYHALDIQEKDFATLMPPEIYVYAQLNRHEGVYDKTNDRINFTTQDGRRNEDFESAIESLIEYAMSNTGGGITPQGIEASFVLVK